MAVWLRPHGLAHRCTTSRAFLFSFPTSNRTSPPLLLSSFTPFPPPSSRTYAADLKIINPPFENRLINNEAIIDLWKLFMKRCRFLDTEKVQILQGRKTGILIMINAKNRRETETTNQKRKETNREIENGLVLIAVAGSLAAYVWLGGFYSFYTTPCRHRYHST